MSDTAKKWMDEAAAAFAGAAKTNAEILKQAFKLPFGLSSIATESGATLSKGIVQYLKLSAAHVSQVVELGRSVSNELLASFEKTANAGDAGAAPGRTMSELAMKGSPGDRCVSAFVLESDKDGTVAARVRNSRFVNVDGAAEVSMPVTFDPPEATVARGEKVRVEVTVGIPDSVAAGMYHAMVWIEGFPELGLRLILTVLAAPEKKTQRAAQAQTGKKRR